MKTSEEIAADPFEGKMNMEPEVKAVRPMSMAEALSTAKSLLGQAKIELDKKDAIIAEREETIDLVSIGADKAYTKLRRIEALYLEWKELGWWDRWWDAMYYLRSIGKEIYR